MKRSYKRMLREPNKHTKCMQHRKDLMHEAKGATLRRNSRGKRGEEEKAVGGSLLHKHCGCGGSGCLLLVHIKGDKI